MKIAIHAATHSQYTVHVLDAIFTKPIFSSSTLAESLFTQFGIHKKTSLGLLRQMKEASILRNLYESAGSRPATLCFPRLVNIAEGREIV